MRLAETDLVICVGGEVLLLRPALRAACRLERRYNGFEPLAKAIADGTLHVIADVILEGSTGKRVNSLAIVTP